MRETYGTNTLDFFYDANGTPYALKHNGTVYYYITNLQGDVIQIVNADGEVVAAYEYDPYGMVISATGTMAEINPIRYRGYYYDSETGFYYLQSRYYDPTTCRFINADAYSSTGQGIIGHNMYAYCENNPVNHCDPLGEFPLLAALGTAVVGAAAGGAVAGALIGGISYLVSNGINGTEPTASGFLGAVGVGALNCAIGGVAGTASKNVKTGLSIVVGVSAGIYAATSTDTSMMQKIFTGIDVGVVAATCTFVGASIDTSGLSPAATAFANYATTLFVGTPAEFVSVIIQQTPTNRPAIETIIDKLPRAKTRRSGIIIQGLGE